MLYTCTVRCIAIKFTSSSTFELNRTSNLTYLGRRKYVQVYGARGSGGETSPFSFGGGGGVGWNCLAKIYGVLQLRRENLPKSIYMETCLNLECI